MLHRNVCIQFFLVILLILIPKANAEEPKPMTIKAAISIVVDTLVSGYYSIPWVNYDGPTMGLLAIKKMREFCEETAIPTLASMQGGSASTKDIEHIIDHLDDYSDDLDQMALDLQAAKPVIRAYILEAEDWARNNGGAYYTYVDPFMSFYLYYEAQTAYGTVDSVIKMVEDLNEKTSEARTAWANCKIVITKDPYNGTYPAPKEIEISESEMPTEENSSTNTEATSSEGLVTDETLSEMSSTTETASSNELSENHEEIPTQEEEMSYMSSESSEYSDMGEYSDMSANYDEYEEAASFSSEDYYNEVSPETYEEYDYYETYMEPISSEAYEFEEYYY